MPPIDPFGQAYGDPFAGVADPFGRRRQAALIQPLQPAEEESALSSLGNMALGGLGWVGRTLDKSLGGATIRSLLGGKGVGESLAHLVPLSDTFNLTNPDDVPSGAELLGFKPHDKSWDAFIGGTAAEIALDPSTYLTFGASALNKLGKVAKKAGALPKGAIGRVAGATGEDALKLATHLAEQGHLEDVAKAATGVAGPVRDIATEAQRILPEVTGKQLGGALGQFNVPGIGSVPIGGERTAKAIDAAKDYLLYTRAGKAISPLFDYRLSDVFGSTPKSEIGQRVVREQADDLAKATPKVMLGHFDEANKLEKAGLSSEAAELRRFTEGMLGPTRPGQEQLLESAGQIQSEAAARARDIRDLGLPTGLWESKYETKYAPRSMTQDELAGQIQKQIERKFGVVTGPQAMQRIEKLDVPGGADTINQILKDPAAAAKPGMKKGERAAIYDYVREKLGWDKGEHDALEKQLAAATPPPVGNTSNTVPGVPLTPEQTEKLATYRDLEKKGEYLAKWAGKLPDEFRAGQVTAAGQKAFDDANPVIRALYGDDPTGVLKQIQKKPGEYLTEGRDFFGNSPRGDATVAQLAHERATRGAKSFYEMLGRSATTQQTEGAMSLADVLKKSSFTGAWEQGGEATGKYGQMVQRLQDAGLLDPIKGTRKDLKKIFIPGEVAADALRYGQAFAMPDNLKPILQAWDYMTNLTKGGQTVLWPAFHARNVMSGIWQNMIGGATYGKGDMIGPLMDAAKLRKGESIDWLTKMPMFKGLSPEEATTRVKELAYAYGARTPATKDLAADLLGRLPQDVRPGELGSFTGRKDKGVLRSLGEGLGILSDPTNAAAAVDTTGMSRFNPQRLGRWNPLDPENFAPTVAGREVSHVGDDMNRTAGFLAYLRQGYDPETAAMRVKALHFGGGGVKYAPFEREVMRRLIPYYGWSRQNIPFQLEQLLQKPGGATGQAARASAKLRQQEGLIPDYVGEGVAIPMGDRTPEGHQRYLSSLGLPFEDISRFVSTGANPVRRTMQKLLGDLNPLIKGPLEYATNTQLYSGRAMDDLFSRTGIPVADQVIMNSPLSRGLSLGSMLLDPRKGPLAFGTNLASPFRLTDVDMQREAATQGRRLLEEQLRSDPRIRAFENFYMTPETARTADPETINLLRLYRTLVEHAKSRQTQRSPNQSVARAS